MLFQSGGITVAALRGIFSTLGPIFPSTMAFLLIKMWKYVPNVKMPTFEQKIADRAKKSTLDFNGVPIRIWQWGTSGPLILFVHGYNGRGTQVASLVEPLIASGFRVISYDAPAHGETPGRGSHFYKLSTTLTAVIEQYGPFHGIITHSIGGAALGVQEESAFKNARVVTVSIPKDFQMILEQSADKFSLPVSVQEKFVERLKNALGDNAEFDMTVLNNSGKFGPKTLVIHDTDDVYFPPQSSEAFANSIPGSTFMKTRGLGHVKILRDDAVVNAITNFMK